MTPEEAAMSLAEDANQFVVFRDSDTSRLSVLYKRKDGNFGLIQP
jgi:putative sigma-54 modulation protein